MWMKSWVELFGAMLIVIKGWTYVCLDVRLVFFYIFFVFLFLYFLGGFSFWGKVVDISCRDGILIHGFND